jgi:hypothetical protein
MRRVFVALSFLVLVSAGCAGGGLERSALPVPAASTSPALAVPPPAPASVPRLPAFAVPARPAPDARRGAPGPLASHAAFFTGEVPLSNGVYFLKFPNGTPFGLYSYLSDPHYVYHFDMGYEYVFDSADANAVYFYDFGSGHYWYTGATTFPYVYDFGLKTWLYYYPDTQRANHYTTNPRFFYNFSTGQIIKLPDPTPNAFVDWTTYGFDNHRDGFNPSSTRVTRTALPSLHLTWQNIGFQNNDYETQGQPLLATNVPNHEGVLFAGGALGYMYGIDALTGAEVWRNHLGHAQYQCEAGTVFQTGIGGSAAYDPASRSLYVVDNRNTTVNGPSAAAIVQQDAVTGTRLNHVDIVTEVLPGEIDSAHTAVTLANGRVYAGTGARCDRPSWRGRVATAKADMSAGATMFYTVYGRGGAFSGGGVWSWGGVSADENTGAVYASVGNADTSKGPAGAQPPFQQTAAEDAGYGDHLLKLSADGTTALDANNPGYDFSYADDLDLAGTPTLFKPFGCLTVLAAVHGKEGVLYIYDTTRIGAGPIARYRTSPSTGAAIDLSNPAWSPTTQMLYAVVGTGAVGSMFPPGMIALRPSGCGANTSFAVIWHTAFGPDSLTGASIVVRSPPTVSAGGVIFTGTPCTPDGNGGCAAAIGSTYRGALWALDAQDGTLLNNGKPLLITGDHIRAPAIVDGNWLYVLDNAANLYGLTLDPSYPVITNKLPASVRRTSIWPHGRRP